MLCFLCEGKNSSCSLHLVLIPDLQVVGESGLFTPADVAYVQEAGVKAVSFLSLLNEKRFLILNGKHKSYRKVISHFNIKNLTR